MEAGAGHHMEQLSFAWGSRQVEVTLLRSARKSLTLEVKPDGSVLAKAPFALSIADVEAALVHRLPWITRQQDYFDSFNPRVRPVVFLPGASVKYLGRQYRLRIRPVPAGEQASVQVAPGYIYLHCDSTAPEDLEVLYRSFIIRRAEELFAQVLKEVLPLFKAYPLPPIQLKVREMPRRWGSCTRKGSISLHPKLLQAPRACIKYVLVHELCHLVVWNHNKAFYDLQVRLLPHAAALKERLERWMA